MQSGLKRARSWRVPPNWSPVDWFEELTAVGAAAAWQALCEFDPARGVQLAVFGYYRVISRCLARYRKEWRYALHLAPGDSCGTETDLSASSAANGEKRRCSNDHLHSVIDTLPTEQQLLIKQLFWEERTETAVASGMAQCDFHLDGTYPAHYSQRVRAQLLDATARPVRSQLFSTPR